jgi:hypothetical protein
MAAGQLLRSVNCLEHFSGIVSPVLDDTCRLFLNEGIALLWMALTVLSALNALVLLLAVPFCHAVRHPGGNKARERVHELASAECPYQNPLEAVPSFELPLATANKLQAQRMTRRQNTAR